MYHNAINTLIHSDKPIFNILLWLYNSVRKKEKLGELVAVLKVMKTYLINTMENVEI